MIELRRNVLNFSFPKVHKLAKCQIDFKRTLRIPDDNREYPLPPGLGRFPIKHVDDYESSVPEAWINHGGVFIPMYQSEALWINFTGDYPCAVKIATGKVNAVSGETWRNDLSDKPQDYVVIPEQPWLDGYNVSDNLIRQFVAMPLGRGYTSEEQITGKSEYGGIQIIAYPMKKKVYKELFEEKVNKDREVFMEFACYKYKMSMKCDMGIAPGGLMRQKIYEDEYGIDVWDQDNGFRCYVHIVNSEQYHTVTGENPPHKPMNATDYEKAGLPWFDYYSDGKALNAQPELTRLKSVADMSATKSAPLSDNDSIEPKLIKTLKASNIVSDRDF